MRATGLAEGGLQPFATDPVSGPERCIGGPGAVSSSRFANVCRLHFCIFIATSDTVRLSVFEI
jgi:hypothetical protein